MMRDRILLIGVLLIVGGALPAQAGHEREHPETFVFAAPIPCGVAACGPEACGTPLLLMSVDDILLTAPEGATRLFVELYADGDRDSFLCEAKDGATTGKVLASDANLIGEPCYTPFLPQSPLPVSCRESFDVSVTAGEQYILRGWNVADVTPAHGTYMFV